MLKISDLVISIFEQWIGLILFKKNDEIGILTKYGLKIELPEKILKIEKLWLNDLRSLTLIKKKFGLHNDEKKINHYGIYKSF